MRRDSNAQQPVLFIGHGSPMNALASNHYTKSLAELGERLPRPRVILVISAHWFTEGVRVTSAPKPRTIHDFAGFPDELTQFVYPAPGHPEFVSELVSALDGSAVAPDDSWGFDHGAWSVLTHLFPKADVPVVQMSLDSLRAPPWHLALARKLRVLRSQGVLIIGSGNIVHNLRRADWRDPKAEPHTWASEFDDEVHRALQTRTYERLAGSILESPAASLSVPTVEHYLPLLYAAGASFESDALTEVYSGIEMGSISMRSFAWGEVN